MLMPHQILRVEREEDEDREPQRERACRRMREATPMQLQVSLKPNRRGCARAAPAAAVLKVKTQGRLLQLAHL
jgi:hypothetical protein